MGHVRHQTFYYYFILFSCLFLLLVWCVSPKKRGNNKNKLEYDAAIFSGRFWEDAGDCVYVCVSLECVTVLGSVQASTQPDGDAGFTLSMTVSSMQQRMRCAKQMDNICSVILKPASGFFFLSDSLFISFSLALFSPWMKSELSSFLAARPRSW